VILAVSGFLWLLCVILVIVLIVYFIRRA